MKHLNSTENEQYQLEVYECNCGFRIGFDAIHLKNVNDITLNCPACRAIISTADRQSLMERKMWAAEFTFNDVYMAMTVENRLKVDAMEDAELTIFIERHLSAIQNGFSNGMLTDSETVLSTIANEIVMGE